MAIVENFYNGDMARPIREIITKNFANVSKYIPNNFISLTTMERQNLSDDYKTHFKLVFDKEQEYIYRWSEVERNWKQYLIRAKDEYARAEADTNTERAFADAEVGIDISGTPNPYTITFYNRKGTAKDSIFLTSANIQYNDEYSTQKIIEKIISDFNSLNDFVGDRDSFLNNEDITAKTITGALNEINQKTIDNKTEIDKILDGTTVVPNAEHANEASHAINADIAEDSNMLGGQLPSYYATEEELERTNEILSNTISEVEKNASDIAELQNRIENTDTDLSELSEKVDVHETKIENLFQIQGTQGGRLDDLEISLNKLSNQVGWEILLSDESLFKVGESYAGKVLAVYLSQDDVEFMDNILGKENISAENKIVTFDTYSISCQKNRTTIGDITYDTYSLYFLCPDPSDNRLLFGLLFELDSDFERTGNVVEDDSAISQITLPSELPICTEVNNAAGDLFKKMTIE